MKLGGAKTRKGDLEEECAPGGSTSRRKPSPPGPSGEPEWTPYQQTDRACLIIDKRDTIVHDVDAHIRAAWGTEVVGFR